MLQDGSRIKRERVGREVVDKPDERHNDQSEPVEAQDQEIGNGLCVSHGILAELLGLFELQTKVEERHGRNGTKTQGDTPDSAEMVLAADPEQNKRHKRGYDKAKVNHKVGEEDKHTVTLS